MARRKRSAAPESEAPVTPTPETPAVPTPEPPAPAPEPEAPAAKQYAGVGAMAKDLMLTTGLTNKQILAKVLEAFPNAKTTYACMAWYRSNLRGKGLLPAKQ